MSTASAALPRLYQGWLAEALPAPIPTEGRASCHDCPMCPKPGEGPLQSEGEGGRGGLPLFEPSTKCCTFLPELPSFLVGMALADPDPEGEAGRASIRARIARRAGVTPLGLMRPRKFGLLYGAGREHFGRSPELRCAHFLPESGLCGIWRYREAVCATWFCRHERGQVGQAFWDALRVLLQEVERALALHAAVELGLEGEALFGLLHERERSAEPISVEELGGAADRRREALWGAWLGREEELYRAAAELVSPLGWAEAVALSGVRGRVALAVVIERWKELREPARPAHLSQGRLHVLRHGPREVLAYGASAYDPLRIPRLLFDHLHLCEGATPDEARERIRVATGRAPSERAIRTLLDAGVLTPLRP